MYRIDGRDQEDSALYPWIVASLVRALVLYGNAELTTKHRIVNGFAVYYSLFHMAMFLVFGCPKHQGAGLRKKIQKAIDAGQDACQRVEHRDVLNFVSAASRDGLSGDVFRALEASKKLREFLNYGPRMYSDSQFVRFDSCQYQASDLERLRHQLPSLFEESVIWAYWHGDDNGIWVQTAVDKARDFIDDANRMYGGWCGEEEAAVASLLHARIHQSLRSEPE